MTRLDTHVVVWLYAGALDRLSDTARAVLETTGAVISPLVELELTYLHEIGRLSVPGAVVVDDLRERMGLTTSTLSTAAVVAAAAALTWTRDPFDRLIVGDASAAGAPLLTKDATIRRHYAGATW